VSAATDALLNRIGDEHLAAQIRAALAQDRAREFGLVFEHHLPETVELPGLAVRPGAKVRMLPRRHSTEKVTADIWQVVGIADQVADLISLDGEQTATRSVFDLVRVADFTDPIYPGLELTEAVATGPADEPWHVLIDAENFHALKALQFTHAESIDTIYIDPPYNTGNDDWIYADRHVAPEDGFRHSKWLSFMERRLRLAWKLVKPTGVIICAIGDDEHHRLRMLLDQVFGEQNFISDVVWQGGLKNDSRYVSNGADYMLIYARAEASLRAAETKWRLPRPAQSEMLEAGRRCWADSQGEPALATALMKRWISGLLPGHPAKTNNRFYEFDQGTGRLFRKDNVSWPGGGGPRYDVLHPVTGQPVRVPGSGWRYPQPQRMQEMVDAGRILFGPDHTHYINRKLYLDEAETVVAASVFDRKRTSANTTLKQILGDSRFPNPKDHTVLMQWIGLTTPAHGTVLDFFGGSGSTLEAVLRLNAQDGGARQCILITNNEVGSKQEAALRKAGHRDGDAEWEAAGVCEYVTKPRIRAIVTGVRPDGSTYPDTVAGNVQFATLTYEDPSLVELDLAFERIAPLLWLMAGARGHGIDAISPSGWGMCRSYGVLFNLDQQVPFLQMLTDQRIAFIVTDDEGQFQRVAAQIPPACRAVRLYESYLRSFELQNEGV
jgi:adenine-specific DNA-methyltransferase